MKNIFGHVNLYSSVKFLGLKFVLAIAVWIHKFTVNLHILGLYFYKFECKWNWEVDCTSKIEPPPEGKHF